jgi:hypothetical protein
MNITSYNIQGKGDNENFKNTKKKNILHEKKEFIISIFNNCFAPKFVNHDT